MKPDFSRSDKDTSYTQAKFKPAYSAARKDTARARQEMPGGCSILTILPSMADSWGSRIAWLLYRCQLSKDKWRSEFDGLVGMWVSYWRAGYSADRIGEALSLTKADQEWLRKEVRKFIPLGPPPRTGLAPEPARRMKKGVASDIVRRRRLGYKQSQVLAPQQDNPLDSTGNHIYRRKYAKAGRAYSAVGAGS